MTQVTNILLRLSLLSIMLGTCEGFMSKGLKNGPSASLELSRNRVHITSLKSTLEEGLSENNFSVVIGKGSDLNLDSVGTLTFSDSLLVEGSLSGRLECLCYNSKDTLVKIGVEGKLRADVKCVAMVEVLGSLTGDVHCQHLIVGPGAEVLGNITTESLEISEGASLLGSVATGSFAAKIIDADSETKISEAENTKHDFNNQPNTMASISVYHDIVQKAALKKGRAAGLGSPNNGRQSDDRHNYNAARANEVLDIVQKAALEKGRAAGLGSPKNGRQSDRHKNNAARANEVLDDFGNSIMSLDKSKGKYVDSFGHPLIRGADDEQVASFREIRSLSSQTRDLLDTHKKKKEKDIILRKATNDENTSEEDGDEGQMPSFLR